MMNIAPISVVIPAFNAEKFISEAIESVLNQTVKVDEIILVDNNCSDRTVEISKELGAKIVTQTKQNLAATRNMGISVCRNDWIAFLDADDFWEKDKIEKQLKAMEYFPDARIIASDSYLFDEKTKSQNPSPQITLLPENLKLIEKKREIYFYTRKISAELFNFFRINASSVIFHQDVFSTVGKFDEEFLHVEAVEFFMRALAHFPFATVKKDLTCVRRHGENRTRNTENIDKYYVLATEKIAASPQKYPSGTLEYFRQIIQLRFAAKGIQLADKDK